jgi:hypothetical protein
MRKTFFVLAVLLISFMFSSDLFAQRKTITITNNSGMALTGVRVSPADEFQWGFNLLVTGNLANNGSVKFDKRVEDEKCLYDISYKGLDEKEYFVKGIDFCTLTTVLLPVPEVGNEPEEKADQ